MFKQAGHNATCLQTLQDSTLCMPSRKTVDHLLCYALPRTMSKLSSQPTGYKKGPKTVCILRAVRPPKQVVLGQHPAFRLAIQLGSIRDSAILFTGGREATSSQPEPAGCSRAVDGVARCCRLAPVASKKFFWRYLALWAGGRA